MSTIPTDSSTVADADQNSTISLAAEIWKASAVEQPLLVKPFFTEMVKNYNVDCTKVDFELPTDKMDVEYTNILPKKLKV